MTKKLKLLAATVLTSLGLVTTCVAAREPISTSVNAAEGCRHEGNHYAQLVPTSENFGCKEYWVCCKCHEHYLTKPFGTWSDAGVAQSITDEQDDRYWGKDTRTELEKELDEKGFKYTIKGDKITITGYDSSMGPNIIIPEGVTNIQAGAFKDKDLDVVVLPSSIKKVEANAFKDSGCAVSGKGDNFVVYVNMTQKQFSKLKNNKDWNAACDESPLGWGLLDETKYAEVVYKPNWHYVNGVPTKE